MPITGFDHVSFPAGDPEAILDFFKRLGFSTIHEEEWRRGDYPLFAIAIGEDGKLSCDGPGMWQDAEFVAKGPAAKPGCGDFCFVFDGSIAEAEQLIKDAGAEVEYGPMDQPGGGEKGQRMGTSIYTRDPDGNLVEFMTYPAAGIGGWTDQSKK